MDHEEEQRRAANEMTGTVYETGFEDPTKPIMIGTVTIAGTILHLAIYPARVSRKGNLVNDVRLHYPPKEGGRLVRVG